MLHPLILFVASAGLSAVAPCLLQTQTSSFALSAQEPGHLTIAFNFKILVDFSLSPLTDLHLFTDLFKTTWSERTGFKSSKRSAVFPV